MVLRPIRLTQVMIVMDVSRTPARMAQNFASFSRMSKLDSCLSNRNSFTNA